MKTQLFVYCESSSSSSLIVKNIASQEKHFQQRIKTGVAPGSQSSYGSTKLHAVID